MRERQKLVLKLSNSSNTKPNMDFSDCKSITCSFFFVRAKSRNNLNFEYFIEQKFLQFIQIKYEKRYF